MKEKNPNTDMSRRSFLQKVGKGMGAAFAMSSVAVSLFLCTDGLPTRQRDYAIR